MKHYLLLSLLFIAGTMASAQTLEKMHWFNEPESWSVENDRLVMDVTPQSDYWRISHYGFTVDDAPFLYTVRGGEFEVKVKITGDYKVRFDQAGLMLRIDKENYIKAGIEFVDGKYNLSTVVTHKTSDWSVIELDKPVEYVWIKAVRRLDAVEIFYSFDDKESEEKTTEQKTEASTEATTEKQEESAKEVTITIKGGMSSYPVCQMLQEIGVIKDAMDFDNYLIKNGYASRISVGTHTLKIGMSYEEIAIAISDPR